MSSSNKPESQPHDAYSQEKTQDSEEQISKSECGICHKSPPKYKCPKCLLPYCSVACNKIHRESHPPDPDPPMPTESESTTTAEPEAEPEATTTPVRDASNPFSALDSAFDKLRRLFIKYPNLPQQLADIHTATQPPAESTQSGAIPASLLKGLPSKKGAWNHDVGIRRGKEALRKARKADGPEGEAVREYCELILYLMNDEGREDATALLQKQVATQDTQLIERLMLEEKRR